MEIPPNLEVRPVLQSEKPKWRALMSAHHYLGFSKTAGESVLYVAIAGDEWLGLLAWAAAALHVSVREEWIGWDDLARRRRLKLVVNNTRFLILPGVEIKNLASKILSLNTNRLSRDWERFYGHPILLAETFVDPSRFKGTCYKAAGWEAVGTTDGFARTSARRGFYKKHGQPKVYLARELGRNTKRNLANPFFEDDRQHNRKNQGEYFAMDIRKLPIDGKDGLIKILRDIKDPRRAQGRKHSNTSVLAIATCAMLSGARNFSAIAEWSKKLSIKQLIRLGCWRKVPPSESTIERVLQRTDPEEFDAKVGDWLMRVGKSPATRGIAVDGKTIRGSFTKDSKSIHLLSALLHHDKVVVAQRNVATKTNEITEFKPLLEPLDIKDLIVTADAMHCQCDHASCLLSKTTNAPYENS